MAIKELLQEKARLYELLDKSPRDEEIKRQIKNLGERIRREHKKAEESKQGCSATLRSIVTKGLLLNKTAEQIAAEANAKITSVRWYISKMKVKQ